MTGSAGRARRPSGKLPEGSSRRGAVLERKTMGRLQEIVHRYDVLPSTNDRARELAEAGAPEGTTVMAGQQTAGRGRHGRSWYSPPGAGLYHSIILRPPLTPARAPLLGLLAAIALAETVSEDYHLAADIKWPNDVLIHEKKVAGILLELEAQADQVRFVILGIGVNLNHTDFPADLAQPATSLRLETGHIHDADLFRTRLFARLDGWYTTFLASGSRPILTRYADLSSYVQGRAVQVETSEGIIAGQTCGVSPSGALCLRTRSGEIEQLLSGDVKRLRLAPESL